MKIKPKVGWIGLGVMGASMAGHLIKQGCSLVVHSRTRSKADQLIQMGAEWIDSPSEVAGNVDYLFSMVGYPEDVEEVYFGITTRRPAFPSLPTAPGFGAKYPSTR